MHAAHNRRAREAARRRQAVVTLRLAEAVARYAADQVADGLSPAEARQAAIDAAGELAGLASVLWTLTRLGPADRARLARLMTGAGMTRREAATRLGVCERTVRYYLAGGRGSAR